MRFRCLLTTEAFDELPRFCLLGSDQSHVSAIPTDLEENPALQSFRARQLIASVTPF